MSGPFWIQQSLAFLVRGGGGRGALTSVLTIRKCLFHGSPHLAFALKLKARAM